MTDMLDAVAAALSPHNLELTALWGDKFGVWGHIQHTPHESCLKSWPIGPAETADDLLLNLIDTAQNPASQQEDKMNIFSSAMFQYLSAEMLGGKQVTMTIKSVVEEEVTSARGSDLKVVVRFAEKPKLWILNKTNARELADYLGPETDNWTGARVTLKTEQVRVGRNTVDALRVARVIKPGNSKPEPVVEDVPEFTEDELADMTDAPAQPKLVPVGAGQGAYSE